MNDKEKQNELKEKIWEWATKTFPGHHADKFEELIKIAEAHAKERIAEVLEGVNNNIISELLDLEDADLKVVKQIIDKETTHTFIDNGNYYTTTCNECGKKEKKND